MTTGTLVVGAALGGAAIACQAMINARLRVEINNALWAATISFAVGLIALAVGLAGGRQAVPSFAKAVAGPWWIWIGGILGAAFIYVSILIAPRLGAALLITSGVVGQLFASLLIDHFGLFGAVTHRLNAPRLFGAVLLIAGVALIRR